jgi:HD-GYP domain-containing protein (c-di-GMP phosphodiesterase class II)
MRLRTRVFLFSFIPFAVLLAFGFWMTQRLVQTTVREGLRSSLRENHLAFARVRSKSNLQNSRFLRIAGENPVLKAGMDLLRENPASEAARLTLEDQLRELCAHMNFDLLYVSAPNGALLAGVVRIRGEFVPLDLSSVEASSFAAAGASLLSFRGSIFEVASVAMDRAEENIGSLSVGEYFSLSGFGTPAVLMRNGTVLESSLAAGPAEGRAGGGSRQVETAEIQKAMLGCHDRSECDVHLPSGNYLSLPIESIPLGMGYRLRSLQDVDSAMAPLLSSLRRLLLAVFIAGVLITLVCSMGAARTVVKPIAEMISHLHPTESTGILPVMVQGESGIREIRDLMASFNRASASVWDARQGLQNAYIEFTGALASALDARDQYTAGHSRRVSQLSCSTAEALNLGKDVVERIRIGALLHDIGKIGIADHVLQKPGRLTDREMAIVRQHPEIGKHILEGVQGFAPFLGAVEFHHENWDGTGYPRGQSEEETPIDARVIHVADAFDAMTSDRPYRRGMTHDEGLRILAANAGIQFDPRIVEAFFTVVAATSPAEPPYVERAASVSV